MSGSFHRKHLNKNFELVGVAASSTSYLNICQKATAEEGMIFYNTTLNQLRTYDGSSWSAAGINSQSAGSLDNAANIGTKITLDFSTSGVEIQADHGNILADGCLLLLDNDDTGSDVHSLEIAQVSTAPAIQITHTTNTSDDIQGTADTWAVTGQGRADFTRVSLNDEEKIYLGTGNDFSIDYKDSATPGQFTGSTAERGLMFEALVSDDVLQIGGSSSNKTIDVQIIGTTSANYLHWDANGGADTGGALILKNADLDLGDGDLIRFGASQDFTLAHQSSTVQHLCLLGPDGQFNIGVDGEGMDMYWYTETASKWLYFDEDNAVVDFVDVDLNLDDDARLFIGDGDDWSIGGTTALAFLPQAAGDTATFTVGDSAGTKVADLLWYTTTNGKGFFIDASADQVYLEGADLKLNDDDYLLLGDDATAGAASDGTIRWAGTSGIIEIIGNTLFKNDVDVDGDLTVSGALNVTGAWDPGNIGLDDDEYIQFGDDNDFAITHFASTINRLQFAVTAANDVIRFGDGETAMDVIFVENDSVSGANFWWDGSGQTIYVGLTNEGLDMKFWSETNAYYMLWDQDGNSNTGQLLFEDTQIIMMDDSAILFGDGSSQGGDWQILSSGTNLIISEVSAAGKMVQFGAVNEGCDVMFYGDTNGYDMLWDQGNDCLYFADNAELCIGAGAGVGAADLAIWSNGTSTSIEIKTALHIATNAGANGKNITFGLSGTNGTDITFTAGASAAHHVKLDAGASTFTLKNIQQTFVGGDSNVVHTINVATDSGALAFAATAHAEAKVWFGTSAASQTHGLDVIFKNKSGTNGVAWDCGATTFTFTSSVQVVFSASDVDYTINQSIATTQSGVLCITATDTSIARVSFGTTAATTNGLDVQFMDGSGIAALVWDAAATTFTIAQPTQLIFSASDISYTINQSEGTTCSGVLTITATDTGIATVQFGTTAATTNGLDVEFMDASGIQAIKWDAAATTFSIAEPTSLIFSGSDLNYTIALASAGGTSGALTITATDTSVAKVIFGDTGTNTNGLDVWLCTETGDSILKWDAGAGTLTTHTTGVSIIVQGSSGVWESGLCIPVYSNEPDTGATAGSIGYNIDGSTICFYNGSAWVKLASPMAS